MSRYAAVFPGQGSQAVGMLAAWQALPVVRQTLEEANAALGFDLAALIADGPEDELNLTANTQPAMLAADVAIWRAWREAGGPAPAVAAGHSLGEYAALVAAEALDFAAALKIVRRRGELMQSAVPAGEGAMAAVIGLDDAAVEQLCREQAAGAVLQAVNFNAPGQVVVAGEAAAVQRLLDHARGAGARMARALPVSVPAHSDLMRPAAEALAETLAGVEFRAPRWPVLHNVDAAVHGDADALRAILAEQVCRPVRWVDTLTTMAGEFGIAEGLECGPGQILSGLAKRTLTTIPFSPLRHPDDLASRREQLETAE